MRKKIVVRYGAFDAKVAKPSRPLCCRSNVTLGPDHVTADGSMWLRHLRRQPPTQGARCPDSPTPRDAFSGRMPVPGVVQPFAPSAQVLCSLLVSTSFTPNSFPPHRSNQIQLLRHVAPSKRRPRPPTVHGVLPVRYPGKVPFAHLPVPVCGGHGAKDGTLTCFRPLSLSLSLSLNTRRKGKHELIMECSILLHRFAGLIVIIDCCPQGPGYPADCYGAGA